MRTKGHYHMSITLQYIPAPDQLNRLKEYEKDYDSLAEAEQFAISISGIKRLVPRLKSLVFRQRYPELVQVRWVSYTLFQVALSVKYGYV